MDNAEQLNIWIDRGFDTIHKPAQAVDRSNLSTEKGVGDRIVTLLRSYLQLFIAEKEKVPFP